MSNILSMLASAAPAYSPEMERRARANGFRSAEEMILWAKQRNTPTGGTIAGASKMPRSAGQAADQAMSWHPRNILQYVLSKMQGATGD